MAVSLWDEFCLNITSSSISRALSSIGWSKKTIQQKAKEQNPDLRDEYIHDISEFKSYHLVYVDESGCDKRIGFRRTGWSPHGVAPVQVSQFHRDQRYQILPRNWLGKRESLESWVGKVADQLDQVFPNSNYDNRREWRDYLPHALYLANSAEFQTHQDNYPDFLARIGGCLQSDGRYGEAEIICRNVLEMRERACGFEDHDTLSSVSQLGSILAQQGKYAEVEAMHRRDLAGSEKILGPEHYDTLTSASQLGSVLARQGKYSEAEVMHRQALEGREKVLGPEHPDTLTSIHNLAFTLKHLGNAAAASSLVQKCAALPDNISASHHPHAIASFNPLCDRETAASQPLKTQEPKSLLDSPPSLNLMDNFTTDHVKSASKPVGRKRRVCINFFRRR